VPAGVWTYQHTAAPGRLTQGADMNRTLNYEIAAARQSEILRDSSRRHRAVEATRSRLDAASRSSWPRWRRGLTRSA
jgi:hypothetical protein